MSGHDEIENSSAPLMEHLTELRERLIKSVLAFIVGMIIAFTVWNPVFNFLTEPLCDALAARGQACDLQFPSRFWVAWCWAFRSSASSFGDLSRRGFIKTNAVRFCRL